MTRRELLVTGALAAGAAAAGFDPVIYSWGRVYPLSGGSNPGIAVMGEPPVAPRPTLLVWYAQKSGSLTPYNTNVASSVFAAAAVAAGFTVCAVDAPSHSGCDKFPNEPTDLNGWAWRYQNGLSIQQAYGTQKNFKQRASAGLDRLIAEGYVDATRIATVGFSRGGLLAGHYAAFDPRIRALALQHPVSRLRLLNPWFAGLPEAALAAADAEDLRLLTGSLAAVPCDARGPGWDTVVNTDAWWEFARLLTAAQGASETYYPPVNAKAVPVAGHTTPYSEHAEVIAWLAQVLV